MTDLAALRALHDAVKAGDDNALDAALEPFIGGPIFHPACDAYFGSLDAAHALHKAVLPGWGWSLNTQNSNRYPDRQADALVDAIDPFRCHGANADTPARAWLLAILAALIAEQEGE